MHIMVLNFDMSAIILLVHMPCIVKKLWEFSLQFLGYCNWYFADVPVAYVKLLQGQIKLVTI